MAENKQEEQVKIDADQQTKLKDKVANQNMEEQVRQMAPAELRKQLSKKNADYIFRLQKELENQGKLSQETAISKINKLLPDLLIAQRHGQPANNFYNMSPKIKAADILKPKLKTAADIPFWQYAVDSALLYVAIFVGIFGLIALFQPNSKNNSQMGILTLISIGALMGIFMTKYNTWLLPDNGKNKKIPWTKIILGMAGIIVVLYGWIMVLSIPALQVVNPVLPGMTNIIIALIAYGIRWLFRRHFEIVGSVFSPAAKNK
ncbi:MULTISPECIES: DUF1129 family protein [unclassified Lactobacillus]|uniref:DUF1129 family protein n=1 Tax=unclassified Lactobacillus TaxID=2620435 RepID=UPI000EFC1E29|nr:MULTISPECIES: DUF1129 family protein [unclassified Lactobacillus]RMC25771.1 DUF1129 domain-containing protein [Lactobacillus sp. ESL0247]RMC29583.1 DUF1129 domain-containing protein [Lactobacillus sp. ESL0246]RMC33572.1 DUF1129 domain-containing protein [Lactobacillus sp. ESL0245]